MHSIKSAHKNITLQEAGHNVNIFILVIVEKFNAIKTLNILNSSQDESFIYVNALSRDSDTL